MTRETYGIVVGTKIVQANSRAEANRIRRVIREYLQREPQADQKTLDALVELAQIRLYIPRKLIIEEFRGEQNRN